MSDKGLVLVTGVTGFVAGHVADQFLAAGYRVRGTTRGVKVKALADKVKRPGLEFVRVDDLIDSDLTEALKGVSAIIHVASPLPGMDTVQHTLDSAVDATLHILREAVKAGITKIVITSTFATMMKPDLSDSPNKTLTTKDYGQVTVEEALDPSKDPGYVYFASKILAENAQWQFVKEHPELDVVSIHPSFIFGPYAETYPRPIAKQALGINYFVYTIMGGNIVPVPPCMVDVRDVAKAHLLAMDLPPSPGVLHRRYLVNSGEISWTDAIEHIRNVHPELKMPPASQYTGVPDYQTYVDTSDTVRDLKFGKFIGPKQVLEDAVVALQEVEKTWA